MHTFGLGGDDYISGPYTAVLLAGETNVSFDVVINDNNIYEGNVYFTITINSSSLPSNVMVGDTGRARVIIVDNERKLLYYNLNL